MEIFVVDMDLLESSGLFLSAKSVLSVKARLETACRLTDVLLDPHVYLREVLVQLPGQMTFCFT